MKRILLLCLTAGFMFAAVAAWAQERTVSGRVTAAEDGSGIPGVNVVLKGTTAGTVTDASGNYTLSVPSQGGTLVFSFIGLIGQEVEIGTRATVDVQLTQDVQQLTEIVVTALGEKKNAREVVYANQTVSGDELLRNPNKNTLEALRGKTAGVRLTTGSGSVGASTRIVLRGESSLTGNNNALIVVDGIPISNETTSGGTGMSTSGYADHGNRFNDINPDDIESVTVLKGPSATSLYGSRGASGVLMITTKKGSKKNGTLSINYNGSYSQEKAIIMLKRQNQFGQGYDAAHFDSGENWSWGPRFDGVVRPWTNPVDPDGDGVYQWLSRPYSNVNDQLQDFFNIGRTMNNSLSVSGANDAFTYYISYSNTDQKGILDNTVYKRNTVTFNASAKLSKKIRSDFKVSYADIDQNTAQEGSRPFEGNNAYAMVVQSPINIPFDEVRDYNSPFHDVDGYWGSYSSVNPYYILNEYGNLAKIKNILGNFSMTYNILENLDITGRFGANIINTNVDTSTPKFTPATQLIWGDNMVLAHRNQKHTSLGEYVDYFKQNLNLDMSLMASYTKQLSETLKFDLTGGYNVFQTEREIVQGSTVGGLVVPGVYNLANSTQTAKSTRVREKYRIVGILANARLGYKDALFLDVSARNDRSSTLPSDGNSFSYWAAGASVILTDLLGVESDVLSFVKLRSSYGTTGKDAPLYQLSSEYVGNPTIQTLGDYSIFFPLNGQPGFTTGNRIGNPNLKPEITTTLEVGADIGLLKGKVNLNYTYYSSVHSKQIVDVSLPRSSGYTVMAGNLGEMTNKGHEVTLSLKPIDGMVQDLSVEIFGTYSKNINEVTKVSDDTDELIVGGPFSPNAGVTIVAKEGLPFGTFKCIAPLTNAAGQTVVDGNTGLPLYTEEEQYFGSFQPDYMASFGLNANFKGFGLNVLFDVKQGGYFISQTKFMTEFNGTAAHTVTHDRQPFIYPNSVIETSENTYVNNDIEITEQDYFTNYDIAPSEYLIDASYVKLREIGLSYTLPKSILSKTPIKNAKISFFGRNLKFWTPAENAFADPEQVGGPALTGNSQGVETTQTPSAMSIGGSLQLQF
jgi:TonB-linked SusC/RagA family outer membrane protein